MANAETSHSPVRIGIVAGESSGDILAAGLIKQLQRHYPDAVIEGIAGPKMTALGCKSLFDMEELSVMGLVEVLSRIRRLLNVRKSVFDHFIQQRPDVFIGVDAPDFNLNLETKLRAQGIKTVHYVSPTVWAWREKRIHGIGRATDLVLSIFPFEKQVYEKHGLACEFVGHTMADEIPLHFERDPIKQQLGLLTDKPILAVLPGSRGSEVKNLLPVFMQTAERLSARIDGLQVVIPAANPVRAEQIRQHLQEQDYQVNVTVLAGQSRQALMASDAVLLASGTATLEALLCKCPMVAAYKLNWLTHQMMKWLYKARFFTLPNLLADKKIVPELLQEDVNPITLSDHLLPLLEKKQQQDMAVFDGIHQTLRCDADVRAAEAVKRLIDAG